MVFIENKNEVEKSIIVLDIIEAIEEFLEVSKKIKTIIDFEEKVKKFMGKGFPHKKDINTLFSLTSSVNNMKFFVDNLNDFQSIMQGYLNEEIRNVYKNFSEEEISAKASINLDKTINYYKILEQIINNSDDSNEVVIL